MPQVPGHAAAPWHTQSAHRPMWEGLDHRDQDWALLSWYDNGGFYFISSLWPVIDNGLGRAFGGHEDGRGFLLYFLNILSFHS